MDISLGEGLNARTINVSLRPFSAVLATARPSKVDCRLRREAIAFDFSSYTDQEMTQIVRSVASANGLRIDRDATTLIASYCDGLPGKAGILIKQLRNYFGGGDVTRAVATEALSVLGYSVNRALSASLPSKLRAMSGGEFEEFVADLFRRMGYSVELTGMTGDHGIDLLLRKDGRVSVVQCKRWENAVGEPVVRDFLGALVGTGASFGFLVTTSYFTPQAISFAEHKPIRPIDIDDLIHLANQAGLPTVTSMPPTSTGRSLFDGL